MGNLKIATVLGAFAAVVGLVSASCSSDPAATSGRGPASDTDGGTDGTTTEGGPNPGDAASEEASGPPPLVYAFVGTASQARISVYEVSTTGSWTFKSKLEAEGEPNWIDVDVAHNHVLSTEGGTAAVRSYTFDPKTAALTFVNQKGSGGAGPAHLRIDSTGKWVYVANYSAGSVSVLPLAADATLGDATTVAAGAQAHFVDTSPSKGFLFVPCVAANKIARYTFNDTTGAFTAQTAFTTGLGGPRHLVFHPSEKFAYAINEPVASIAVLGFDKTNGTFSSIETKSTLPAGFTDPNSGAEIAMHPSGKFLYGSNRGHDSIAIFTIDQVTGKLTAAGHASTEGDTPRSFSLSPDGQFLFAGNEESGGVTGFRVDPTSGALTSLGKVSDVALPTVVRLFSFPR